MSAVVVVAPVAFIIVIVTDPAAGTTDCIVNADPVVAPYIAMCIAVVAPPIVEFVIVRACTAAAAIDIVLNITLKCLLLAT